MVPLIHDSKAFAITVVQSFDRSWANTLENESSYLEYELSDTSRVILVFETLNNRDGCYISLDMYKAQLGPVTKDVLQRILLKFNGQVVTASS
jgi:hypothetical protein